MIQHLKIYLSTLKLQQETQINGAVRKAGENKTFIYFFWNICEETLSYWSNDQALDKKLWFYLSQLQTQVMVKNKTKRENLLKGVMSDFT